MAAEAERQHQLLSTAVHDTMPGKYVRPESQRPRLDLVVSDARIPVVDLASPDRAAVISAVGDACRTHGFFQVVNHGIDAGLIMSVMEVGREFFRLPAEEKAKLYSDDPAKKIRLSTSFNVRKETVHNWRDYLRLHCYPLDQFVPDWPSNPPSFNRPQRGGARGGGGGGGGAARAAHMERREARVERRERRGRGGAAGGAASGGATRGGSKGDAAGGSERLF